MRPVHKVMRPMHELMLPVHINWSQAPSFMPGHDRRIDQCKALVSASKHARSSQRHIDQNRPA